MGSVLVIGGGAAGLAAAIAAAECGDTVTVAEKMDRVGKKILATGNGRCNLMNTGAPRYPGNAAFAAAVLSHCGAEKQKAFWEHLGLPTGKTKKSLSISMEFIVQLMYGSTVRKSVIRKGPVMMQNFVSLLTSKRVIIRLPWKFTAGVTAVSLKIRICSV